MTYTISNTMRRSFALILMSRLSSSLVIQWVPSSVTLERVSHSYPDTLWRKLTSSEPRRELALDDVSLSWGPSDETTSLLLGESSSGKSALLKLITGKETPIEGTVRIENYSIPSNTDAAINSEGAHSKPVYLDARPSYGQSQVVQDIWMDASIKAGGNSLGISLMEDLSSHILLDLSLASEIRDLSTSEVYRCRIGEACIESMLSEANLDTRTSLTTSSSEHAPSTANVALPAPVLLLDEWLDTETTSVVQNILSSLQELARRGAVIICVTHKPQLFDTGSAGSSNDESTRKLRRITMRRGKVVSS